MDAKPQRPLRTFKIRDENLPPTVVLPGKTIHQRNKSSPALSTIAQVGGVKLNTKRAAFADVSNTARTVQGFRDDSSITSKPLAGGIRDALAQETSKNAGLLRPAQRPLSVSGIKGFFNNITSNTSSNFPRHTNVDTGLTRKATAIFKERDVIPPQLLHQDVKETRQHASLATVQEVVDTHHQKYYSQEPLLGQSIDVCNIHKCEASQKSNSANSACGHGTQSDAFGSDRVHLDLSNVPDSVHSNPHSRFDAAQIYEDAPVHVRQEIDNFRPLDKPTLAKVLEHEVERPYLLPISEPDEYWEEDGYDDVYEDGYTTARSVKSTVDYVTGPTTVVLAPRMTARVELELAAARRIVIESRTADSIEEDESWDTSMVAEYGEEIFDYMRTLEDRMRPNQYYMDSQTEVQWSMRSVLMDWLVQVHLRFSLLPETLFLCVNYIDRFLSCKIVSLGKLQLVGATAIFIAAKYEEINCPSIQEIVYMVDGGYTVDEILKAERFMLSMLQFELGWPGPMSFLRRVSKADDYDLETRTLAKYFLEITIMDERFVGCVPSFTAAGAHCLARLMLKKGSWTPAHVFYSNYTYTQLRPLLVAMLSCCEDPQKHHQAIYDKYGDKRFKRASYFVQSEINKGLTLPPILKPSTAALVENQESR